MNDLESYRKPNERIDDLQRDGLYILQDPNRFCFGMDAVLLSGFAEVRKNERVLDLGTGTGILPILLAGKTQGREFVGLEIQEESADMASRSVLMNGLQDRVKIINGDAQNAHETFGASSFDGVVSNPPYMKNQHGLKNEEDAKQIARHEICGNLEDFIRETAKVLKPKGRCYFVHRPFRIVDLMELMRKYKIEPKKMQLVHPYVDHEPNMVLIEGVRGGNPWLKVEPPLIVYDKPNVYSEEALRIYGK
mgnify:CR=1 FL=1